jgi:hypothetical protein
MINERNSDGNTSPNSVNAEILKYSEKYESDESEPCSVCFSRINENCKSDRKDVLLCQKCKDSIDSIKSTIAKKFEYERNENKLLTSNIINTLKELQDIKTFMKSKIHDITIIETLKTEKNILQKDFKDSINSICGKEKEIRNLNFGLAEMRLISNQKQEKIDEFNFEASSLEQELINYKKNFDNMPKDAKGFYLENQGLREKAREIEIEKYRFIHEMIDTLQVLKAQILIEKDKEDEPEIPTRIVIEKTETLEELKNKSRRLQEEISITKSQIEYLKKASNMPKALKNKRMI